MTAPLAPVATPFLKSVGGKRQLLPQLLPHIPARFGRYHEPFVGGGALFFHLHAAGRIRKGATLSDVNERTVRAWRGVRDNVETVIDLLRGYPYNEAFFYDLRRWPIDARTDAEVAAWRIYLSKAGFNGLYRENRSGQCNTPFGRYTNPRICDDAGLRRCSAALAGVDLRIEDFGRAAVRAKRGDLVFADSPYVPLSETSSFTAYSAGGFGLEDQVRLRDAARSMKLRGVRVLLTNSSAPTVRELYADFALTPMSARRAVSCQIEGRGPVTELLIA